MTEFNQKERELIEQLKKLKQIQPDFDYLRSFGLVLKTKVELEKERIRRPQWSFRWLKMGVVGLTGFLVVFSLSWGMVLAIQQVPSGTIFYPVKLISEKLQLEMSKNDPKQRRELRIKFANNRLAEIKILEENNALDEEKLNQALENYQAEISAIQAELLRIVNYNESGVLAELLSLENKLREINTALQQLSPELKQSPNFSRAEELSRFVQEVASLKILDAELQHQSFGQDEHKLQRVQKFLAQLTGREENLLSRFGEELSLTLKTKAVEINERGELNVSPAPGKTQEIYQRLLQIKESLTKLSQRLSTIKSDEELLRLLQELKENEIRLAEIESWLK